MTPTVKEQLQERKGAGDTRHRRVSQLAGPARERSPASCTHCCRGSSSSHQTPASQIRSPVVHTAGDSTATQRSSLTAGALQGETETETREFSADLVSSAEAEPSPGWGAWGCGVGGLRGARVWAGQLPGSGTRVSSPRSLPLGSKPLAFSALWAQQALRVGGLGGPAPGPHVARVPGPRPCGTGDTEHIGVSGVEPVGCGRRSPRDPTVSATLPRLKPTGSPPPGGLHLAPRSALWETESSAGPAPRRPQLENYIPHKALGRYSRGLLGRYSRGLLDRYSRGLSGRGVPTHAPSLFSFATPPRKRRRSFAQSRN